MKARSYYVLPFTAFFHFPGPYNLKNGDNSKSPKNELLGFAMQQEK